MPKVRWVMSDGFCSKFHTLSSSGKILKKVKICQSYREFKLVGTLFRHSGWGQLDLTQCTGSV